MMNDLCQMAWNEPGSQRGKDKDNDPNNPWKKNREPEPPDLEQIFRKLKNKLIDAIKGAKNKGKMGGGSGNGLGGGGSGGRPGPFQEKEFRFLAYFVIGALILLYLLSGIYIVQPPERAVVTRFGKYIRTEGPGPHWLPVFIEAREIVNVDQVATTDHSGLMLTKDRNIASVGVAVQYHIGGGVNDVKAYLFDVVNPVHSLKQSAESALRQVVGQYTMDEVLTLKRSEIANAIKEQIIDTIKNYQTGIVVVDVAMQFAKAPDEVRAAFDDVIKAAADEERLVNQARAYENEVLPRAKGTVERLKNEALAYKQETILRAEGNVQRFNAILTEYQKAPKVTQTRLYLDTMEQVLSKLTKIVTDPNSGNNFIYLPGDRSNATTENSVTESEALLTAPNGARETSSSGARETSSSTSSGLKNTTAPNKMSQYNGSTQYNGHNGKHWEKNS